jgi:hypothetical protein
MKKSISIALLLLFVVSNAVISGDRFRKSVPPGKDKPYFKEVEKLKAKKNSIFNLNLDIQLGMDFSKATVETNQTGDTSTAAQMNDLQNTKSKAGPSIGAILSLDFLGFGFTTGIHYSGKGIKTEGGYNQNLNYLNIPLLIYFNFDFPKVIIDGNVGPYFGLLMSQDENSLYKVKNFDLGITGNLQGAYLVQKHIGILLGVKFEYGGLNNLVQNTNINSIRTQTYFVYTGVKFVL